MTDLHMNYFAWGAAHYQERGFLAEIMFQASVMDYQIDLQTYLKSLQSLYFLEDHEMPQLEKQKSILYYYTLLANEKNEDFHFGADMLEEYIQ